MISPFVGRQVRECEKRRVVSWGLSSAGYDIRVAPDVRYAKELLHCELDPKAVTDRDFQPLVVQASPSGAFVVLPPHGFALACSVETFHMPESVMGIVQGKSTLIRSGLLTPMTPLEPGWRGKLTLEISNLTPRRVRLYVNEGIAQVIFYRLQGGPLTSYADRAGKYQDQVGVTLPRM